MPIYEFYCKDCRSDFKTLRASDRISEVKCPTCGAEKLERLFSVTAQTRSSVDLPMCPSAPGAQCHGNPEACGCRFN